MMDAGDVLIVGAGPVGMFAALALAQAGVHVTVIEGEESISDAPRAPVYFPVTMTAFAEMGVLEDLDRQGMRVQNTGHRVPDLNFHAQFTYEAIGDLTYNYQIHAGQDVATRIACEHAVKAGVKVLFSHNLVSFEQNSDSIIAVVETPDGPRKFQSKWLIGCDGARSTVRKGLEVGYDGFTWPNRFVATNVYCDFASLGIDPAGFICDPVYMAMLCVLDKNGLWRLTYQEDGALPAETFMERLPERYAYHIPAGVKYEITAARPYTIHQRCASQMRKGRVLLAGDAAHCTNPMGGLGLTTGLWDGLILADVLGAVLRGEEDEAILDRYSDERRRIYLDISSPAACENKRMMEEANPERRKEDCATIQRMIDDPHVQRVRRLFPFRVVGNVLRENSRWKDVANPLKAVGIDVNSSGTLFS